MSAKTLVSRCVGLGEVLGDRLSLLSVVTEHITDDSPVDRLRFGGDLGD
jgi:hypothetical protein